MTTVYKGFSTVIRKKPPYTLTDIELVKNDLMNHFNTKKGERVMMPNFGSVIHDVIMDPLDSLSIDIIREDVRVVLSSDPRVRMQGSPIVKDFDSTVRVEVEVVFDGRDTAEHLYVDFQRELREAN